MMDLKKYVKVVYRERDLLGLEYLFLWKLKGKGDIVLIIWIVYC